VESKEKDMLISQLKAHIFELEQHDKDYDTLNHKYRQLQNDCTLLNEAKLRLEYELRQKDENYNKQICDLRNENENLQLGYNEKLSVNKKLFAENDSLSKQLDMKNEEIRELTDRLNELLAQLDRSQEDRAALERHVQGLNDVKMSQKTEITKLIEDNKKLSKICQDQDRSMKLSEQECHKLASKLDETNYDLKNVTGQLRSREENLNFTQGQLEENKNLNLKLQSTIRDYERQFENMRNDIDGLKNNLLREKQSRNEEEKRGEQLEGIIQERERELNRLGNDIENMKVMNQRISDDKMNGQIENDKLKNHIMVLTQQNQKLIAEIENILDQDEKMKEQLSRKDRIVSLLRNNKSTIEHSLNNIDDFLNRSNNNVFKTQSNNVSQRYTYSRMSPEMN
jgi:chromosome segregation ATPase